MKVLVTGGAGYIGSHMVKLLGERGHAVVVVDDLSTGHRDAVLAGRFVEGNVGDKALMTSLLAEENIEAVVHFAGSSLVAESVANPDKYRRNNVDNTRALLEAMQAARVDKLVFSSSAAVYGEPRHLPIEESHPTEPLNPYGESKLAIERALGATNHLRHVSLRYFNAAGADPGGELGERHDPETHLIPMVLQAASGRRKDVGIYGSDYPTRDGTCVRDYVHVTDLCEAHLLALDWLARGGEKETFNLGTGTGATVLEVIEEARRQSGRDFPARREARRAGDPASLVAGRARAERVLGWRPRRSDLASIVRDAWRWEQRQR
jgi:UDP-glucose 4-epimerase